MLLTFLSAFPERTAAFFQGDYALGKGNNNTSGGLQDTGPVLRLIPGNPKCPCGPPVRVGPHAGQMINGDLAQVHLAVGPVDVPTHPVLISPGLEYMIGLDILSYWQNLYFSSMTYGVRVIMVVKSMWRLPEPPLPRKTVSPKQWISG